MQNRALQAKEAVKADKSSPNYIDDLIESARTLLQNTAGIDNQKIINLDAALKNVGSTTEADST